MVPTRHAPCHRNASAPPRRTPKDPWGYYAPEYDPDTDPWETESDREARQQQEYCQRMQQQQQRGAQLHAVTAPGAAPGAPNPVVYVMPPGANRWGYTLTYYPPTPHQDTHDPSHGHQHTQQDTVPQLAHQQHPYMGAAACAATQAPQQPVQPPPTTQPQEPQTRARPPQVPQLDIGKQAPATPGEQRSPETCHPPSSSGDKPEAKPAEPQTPEAGNGGAPQCSHPQAEADQQPTDEGGQTPQASLPADPQAQGPQQTPQQPYRNRWGRTLQPLPAQDGTASSSQEQHNAGGPHSEAAQQHPASTQQGGTIHQATTEQTQPRGNGHTRLGDPASQPQSTSSQAAAPDTLREHPPSPQPHQQQQTTTADSSGGSGGQPQAQDSPELEEVPSSSGGTTGGASQQRPYHEGRGDQRMRGKRFKAAVQAAFNQRGWTKDEAETWKGVAHLVGLSEEDEEETWAKALAEGPPPWERATRPDRRPGGSAASSSQPQHNRGQTRPGPHQPQGGQTVQPNWTAILSLHGKPRGSVTDEHLQQLQRPPPPPPPSDNARPKTAAAGDPPSDPRRRRQPASTTTAEQPEDQEEPLTWDGLFSTMLLSPGGAPRPITFPPEIPTAWGVDVHYLSLPHGAWAGIAMATGSRRAPEYTDPRRGYFRARLRRRLGGATPAGYMSISTAFVLFP